MHLLGYKDIFTTKTSLTRVRAVPRYSFSIDTLEGLNFMRPTIGIMPSGVPWVVKPNERFDKLSASLMFHRNKGNTKVQTVERSHQYIYSVPYSDHSCFAELEDFIKLVKPGDIKGIVSSSTSCVHPLYYFARLCLASQSSERQQDSFMRKEQVKKIEAVQSKSTCISLESSEAGKKRGRKAELDNFGVHVSKFSAMRRLQRGAKIMENEYAD